MKIQREPAPRLTRRSTSSLAQELALQAIPRTPSSQRLSATDLQALDHSDQVQKLDELEKNADGITLTTAHRPGKMSLADAVRVLQSDGAPSVTVTAKLRNLPDANAVNRRGSVIKEVAIIADLMRQTTSMNVHTDTKTDTVSTENTATTSHAVPGARNRYSFNALGLSIARREF